MTMVDPAFNADEQKNLESYLDHYKTAGLKHNEPVPSAIVFKYDVLEKLVELNGAVLQTQDDLAVNEKMAAAEAEVLANSNLYKHAQRELGIIRDKYQHDEDMPFDEHEEMLHEGVLKLVREFVLQHHSGASASVTLGLFEKLASFESLTPITDSSADWVDVGLGPNDTHVLYQNKRDSRMFSLDEGKTYYNVNNKPAWWRKLVLNKLVEPLVSDRLIQRARFGKFMKSEPHTIARSGS